MTQGGHHQTHWAGLRQRPVPPGPAASPFSIHFRGSEQVLGWGRRDTQPRGAAPASPKCFEEQPEVALRTDGGCTHRTGVPWYLQAPLRPDPLCCGPRSEHWARVCARRRKCIGGSLQRPLCRFKELPECRSEKVLLCSQELSLFCTTIHFAALLRNKRGVGGQDHTRQPAIALQDGAWASGPGAAGSWGSYRGAGVRATNLGENQGKPWEGDAFLTQERPWPVPGCSAPLPARGRMVLPVPARGTVPRAASPAGRERSGSQWLTPVFILR